MSKVIMNICHALTFVVGILNMIGTYGSNNNSAALAWFVVVCLSASHIIRDYCASEKSDDW